MRCGMAANARGVGERKAVPGANALGPPLAQTASGVGDADTIGPRRGFHTMDVWQVRASDVHLGGTRKVHVHELCGDIKMDGYGEDIMMCWSTQP